MMSLYNEEEVMRSYIKSERYEAEQNKAKKTAVHLLKLGKMSLEDIAEATELPLDVIKELVQGFMEIGNRIITAYYPDRNKWTSDFKTRKEI